MKLEACVFCTCILYLCSCTDPRSRPVPPLVEVQFGSAFKLTSPGQIIGSVYLFDDDGLDSLVLSVRSADATFAGDSVIFFPGVFESTRLINWTVPAGLATGSQVTVVAKVADFSGFVTSDSVKLTIQTAAGALR